MEDFSEKNNYYGIQAISNSALSYINPEEKGCPEKFFDFLEGKLEQKESKAMLTGTLVHSRILEPDSITVAMVPKISDNVKAIVEMVFDRLKEEGVEPKFMYGLSEYENLILAAATHLNYGQSWKQDTLISKICKEGGTEYFRQLIDNDGKFMLSQDVFARLLKIESAIKSTPSSRELLIEEMPGYMAENEMEIFWEYTTQSGTTLKCKSKLDRCLIDFTNKTFKIIDLKTGFESVEFFPEVFQNRHIYRQLAFYEMALQYRLSQELPDQNFTAEHHTIIYAESEGYNRVRRFDVSRSFIEKGFEEIKSLMERIAWHIENNERVNSYEDILSGFSFFISE